MKLIRKFMCLTGQHLGRINSDETGLWHECDYCGKRTGHVSREELRRTADDVVRRETVNETYLS